MLRSPGIRGLLALPAILVLFGAALADPPTSRAVDACDVLTAAEVERATGMPAQPGAVMEVWTGAIGCSFGTEPFDVRVSVSEATSGRAVDGLGAGDPVEGVGDGARWVWCDTCADVDSSFSSNMLVVAEGTTYLHIAFHPTTDEAGNEAWTLQAEQLEQAIELARLALPRLAPAEESAAPDEPVVEGWSPGGSSTYTGTWTLIALLDDFGEPAPDQEQVGDTAPGTLTIDCLLGDAACNVTATFDGDGWAAGSADVVDEGVVRSVQETRLDNCVDGQTYRQTIEVHYGPAEATATHAVVNEPRTCDDGAGGTLYSQDVTWAFEGALSEYLAPAVPSAGADPSADPSASAAPGTDSGPEPDAPTTGSDPDGRPEAGGRPFAASVPSPAEVSTDPLVVLQSAALAALLVFLMPFPSQLFNSTLETHEEEVRRWLHLDRLGAVAGGIGAFWASWPGVALFTVLAALLYGFLDPGFGIDLDSLATFLGMLLGIVLVTVAFAVPTILAHRRHGERPSLKVVPISLLVGVACVVLSRLTDFQPGYLYGLLIGLAFARELSAAEEGRATAIGAGLMLAVAFASWLALGALPDGDGFGLVVARTALAALMVAGLEGVVFGLLPMRFLPGEPLYAWNRVLWGLLLAIGAFAFFHILINPASGYLADTSRTPLLTVLALLVGFSAISVAFWAWFRFRPSAATA